MIWRAELSNNDTVYEVLGDVGSWRRLKNKCESEGLSIRSLGVVGENGLEFPNWTRPISFFVFHEAIAILNKTGQQAFFKKALGCVYDTEDGKKVRIYWYGGQQMQKMHAQVGMLKDWDFVNEISIPKQKEM